MKPMSDRGAYRVVTLVGGGPVTQEYMSINKKVLVECIQKEGRYSRS